MKSLTTVSKTKLLNETKVSYYFKSKNIKIHKDKKLTKTNNLYFHKIIKYK